jgi:putative tricarboxylic transport membrane protein
VTETDLRPPRGSREHSWRITSRTVFFGVLLVVLIGYTELAFEMDWRSASGRIGPGFFPRIIGVLASLIALGALANSLRPGVSTDESTMEDEVGEGDLGRHPGPLLLSVAACGVLLLTMVPLGAIIAGAVFTFGMLAFLNPGRWALNAIIGVAVPVGLYLLFQTALNAGLPAGLLPAF